MCPAGTTDFGLIWNKGLGARSPQELEEAGRTLPWSLLRGCSPVPMTTVDFWPQGWEGTGPAITSPQPVGLWCSSPDTQGGPALTVGQVGAPKVEGAWGALAPNKSSDQENQLNMPGGTRPRAHRTCGPSEKLPVAARSVRGRSLRQVLGAPSLPPPRGQVHRPWTASWHLLHLLLLFSHVPGALLLARGEAPMSGHRSPPRGLVPVLGE